MRYLTFFLLFSLCASASFAQQITYPYPLKYIYLTIENQPVRMAYMDVAAEKPDARVILLLHGKNFNGYYWKNLIEALHERGFRVVVPDQVGFGKSDKPNIHYSFSVLATNTKELLDSLKVEQVVIISHSMGGMLATRFALMYPQLVEKLIYENPIGLEDYRVFVPYRRVDEQYAQELKSDYESLKKYQQGYYPKWKREYEQYVAAQYEMMQVPDFMIAAWSSALTYDMIYQQPVMYEFKNIVQPALIIIGQEDRTIVGKSLLSQEVAKNHGQYPQLGRMFHEQVHGSTLVELPGVGHIPHIQSFKAFLKPMLEFLK
jgi:pimeloyl-ACP methyl ester carboxylesterase